MDAGTPDGDGTEGLDAVEPDAEAEANAESELAPEDTPIIGFGMNGVQYEVTPSDLQRMVKWTRIITVIGPEPWVTATRGKSLVEGTHIMGNRGGIPCVIDVTVSDAEPARGIKGDMTYDDMQILRGVNPEYYESIHGSGTAKQHAAMEDTQPSRPIQSVPTGGYL